MLNRRRHYSERHVYVQSFILSCFADVAGLVLQGPSLLPVAEMDATMMDTVHTVVVLKVLWI